MQQTHYYRRKTIRLNMTDLNGINNTYWMILLQCLHTFVEQVVECVLNITTSSYNYHSITLMPLTQSISHLLSLVNHGTLLTLIKIAITKKTCFSFAGQTSCNKFVTKNVEANDTDIRETFKEFCNLTIETNDSSANCSLFFNTITS